MKNPFYDKILNGMIEHQRDLPASQKKFCKHLRSKVSADLAPEAEKIDRTHDNDRVEKFLLKSESGNDKECGKRTTPGSL